MKIKMSMMSDLNNKKLINGLRKTRIKVCIKLKEALRHDSKVYGN